MVLGYFGKTPVEPDAKIVELASEQLKLKPTKENPLDISDRDPKKSIKYFREMLEDNQLEVTEENIFIAAACDVKGIEFLKGNGKVMVRKNKKEPKEQKTRLKSDVQDYTVIVNGNKYSVHIAEGADEEIEIKSVKTSKPSPQTSQNEVKQSTPLAKPANNDAGEEVKATLPGSVFKLLVKDGDSVKKDEIIMILEAMKMEIEIPSPTEGTITLKVAQGDTVENDQVLAVIG